MKASSLPCHEYTYNLCLSGGGEKLGRPILSPPWQNKASACCRWLSGWRKTWLVHYFPTLTSESINHNLSWIHIQPLLFRGWGKTGPAQSSTTLTSESINLVQKLGYLGEKKTGLAHSFPTLTSKSISLTLSWICKQSLLFRGWGKSGLAHFFPTLTCVSVNLVQKLGYLGGEKLGWQVKTSTLPCHEYTYNLCL